MTQKEAELLDSRMTYRINRQEREKKKQREKHRIKIENTDWLSILNEEGDDSGRNRPN